MSTDTLRILILACLNALLFFNCVQDRNFDPPAQNCPELTMNTTYEQVKNRYSDATFKIQEDLIIEGYVNSSDAFGNFYSVLHFQDRSIKPTDGFRIELDLRDTHLVYPVGSKIYIKLKGLYLGKSKGVFKLGGAFTSFGNISVGRLPATRIKQHVFVSCDAPVTIVPTEVTIKTLQKIQTSTLVQLTKVQFSEKELEKPFADDDKETARELEDCDTSSIELLNSGFSDFHAMVVPSDNGIITGVLLRENELFKLAIRDLEDIDFKDSRCTSVGNVFTSTTIFISELADPDNDPGARFLELYNSANVAFSLNGWSIQRYTNDSEEVSSTVDLSPLEIAASGTLIISPNADAFENRYGFVPDLAVGVNSPADSNGDDNFVVVDPFGDIIDAFGVIGEDGSTTNHEYEDGKAVRHSDVTTGTRLFNATEWTIYNDSGGENTIKQPQVAPQDFNPGKRN